MAVQSLDDLGVAPEDMTPSEAKELARLMAQVRALEEGAATGPLETRRGNVQALFTAPEKRTKRLVRPKSARARYPSKTLARSCKDFAKKQQAFRQTELKEKEDDRRHRGNAPTNDEEGAPPAVQRPEAPRDVVTRVVLWPEYALLRDGDVRVHIERHYREAPRGRRTIRPRWQLVAAAERARRRLELRLEALKRYGPPELLGDARVHGRGDRRASSKLRCAKLRLLPDSVEVEEPPHAPAFDRPLRFTDKVSRDTPALHNGRPSQKTVPMREVCGFSVQVAAHARGSLYMDTLHSTLARKALEKSGARLRPLGTSDLVEGLMGWLAHLGMPVANVDAQRITEYETERVAQDRAHEEEQADSLVRMLVGVAGTDVAYGALVDHLRDALVRARAAATPDGSSSDDEDPGNDLTAFGARAYREVRHHVVDVARRRATRRAVVQAGAKEEDAALVMRLAKLVDDHGLDLQEVFLDAPTAAGAVRADVRVPAAQLRTGLRRMLCCLAEDEFDDPGDV